MTDPDPANPPNKLLQRGFFAVIATQMAFSYALSTFLLLPKYLTTQFHATAGDIGHVGSIPGMLAVLSVPFVGGLLDRIGRRPLMAAGACLALIYSLAWLSVDHLGPLVYALQIFSGIAFMCAFSGSSTLATDLAPPERLSQAIGVFGAANTSMNALAPAIAEPTAERFGWHAAFGLAAAAAALSLWLSRQVREPARVPVPRAKMRTDVIATLRVARRLLPYVIAMATAGAAFGACFTFYQPFVIAQGAQRVSTFFIGFVLATIGTRVGLGSLADRLGRRRVAVQAFCVYALVVLAMTQLTPGRLLAFGFALGCAHGFFYPALNGLALELTDKSERGRAMTLIYGSFHLGNTSSVISMGWVAHHFGYRLVFVLASLLACVGIATLLIDAAQRDKALEPQPALPIESPSRSPDA